MTAKQNLGSQAPDGSTYVTLTDGSGALGSVTVSTSDIEIGAVEIKDGTTDNRTSVSAAGALKVDNSGVTQPVSGTITANAGTGTLAVSLASVPSHAVTNAGTFAVQNTALQHPGVYAFQRPADTTAYAVGDLIANSTTAGSVVAMSWTGATISGGAGSGTITGVQASCSTATAKTIRIHFFNTAPAPLNGDNGVFQSNSFALNNYIGYADVVFGTVSSTLNGGGAVSQALNLNLQYRIVSGDTIYGLIEAGTVFTPGNAEFYAATPKFSRNT